MLFSIQPLKQCTFTIFTLLLIGTSYCLTNVKHPTFETLLLKIVEKI